MGEKAAAARPRRARRGWRNGPRSLSASRCCRFLCTDRRSGRVAVATAHAVADGQRGSVSPRSRRRRCTASGGPATTTRSSGSAAESSTERTAEQTAIARFWEATLPAIYHGLVQSLARTPGRDVTQNARLFAAVTQAADDALIAVFDAKYHYGFWRPITAIRNGDIDGNDATERDPAWLPFIDTPLHPEYPCAHCIVAAAVGAVLEAEVA